VTVPHRVQGMSYTVNPGEPVSAPAAYTARSVAVVAVVSLVLFLGLGLMVFGAWAYWGWPIGVFALGAALIAALLLATAWPTPARTRQ
jgi:hypothetical protein